MQAPPKKLNLVLAINKHLKVVKPNTYLGRAKERWMQSLASESLLQATSECACAI